MKGRLYDLPKPLLKNFVRVFIQKKIKDSRLISVIRSSGPIFAITALLTFFACQLSYSDCKKFILEIFSICPQVCCYLEPLVPSMLVLVLALSSHVERGTNKSNLP